MNSYLDPKDKRIEEQLSENERLRNHVAELEQRLAESQTNLRALIAERIDAILEGPNTTPLLLREAQAALRRSNAELEQKVAERTAELHASEERYRLASQAVNGVLYDWDLRTGEILRSSGMENLVGYLPDAVPCNPEWWLDLIEPEDRAAIDQRFEQAIQSGSHSFEAEYRVRHRDGHRVHVWDRATILRDNQAQGIRLVGTVTDITPMKQIVEALRISDERFRIVMTHAGITAFSQDRELRYTWTHNPINDYSDMSHIGKSDEELPFAEEMEELIAIKRQVLETGIGVRQELRLTIQNQTRDYDLIIEPLKGAHGAVVGILGSAADITDRKQAEAALRESEERYRLASQAVSGVLYDWDLRTGEIGRSPGMEKLIGYDPDKVPGDPAWWRSLVEPEDRIEASQILEAALQSSAGSYQAEYRVRHKEGHWVAIRDQATILRDDQGQVIRMVGTASDITHQKQMMEALRISDARFRVALAHAGIIVFSQDRDLRYTWMYNQLPGYAELDHIGKTDKELFLPEEDAELTALKQQVLATGKGVRREVRATIPGRSRDFDLILEPLRDAAGEIAGVLGAAADITNRKQAEAALRESEERFRIMADGTPIVIWVTDAAGRMDFINRAYTEFFGVTLEQVQNGTWQALVHPDDKAGYVDVYIECMQERRPFRAEARTLHKSGQWRWIHSQGQPRFSVTGEFLGMAGSSLDITDRKQFEAALYESEGRFRAMADGTPALIWVHDAAGNIEFINRAWTDFFGKTLDQVRNEDWQPLVHPEDAGAYVDEFVQCTREHRPFRAEVRARHKSGEWRWVESLAQPRFSQAGDFLGMAGSSLDITERKQAEDVIRDYTTRLEQSNRDLEEFAFVASHDLQEPLLKVSSFGRTLQDRFGEQLGADGLDYVRRMRSAAERMQQMIDDLLRYSRINSGGQTFESVDLNAVAREVLDNLEARVIRSKAHIDVSSLPVITADPAQMRQLLQNLIGNALKFSRPDVQPVVKVGVEAHDSERVRLFVTDNGIGFDEQYREAIFLPFKRLHARHQYTGSGIGLALCRKIVERHGGTITAESRLGEGSTFLINLPVHPVIP